MSFLEFREALLGDENEIAKVNIDSWRLTYSTIVPKKYLDELSIEKFAFLWRKIISNQNSTFAKIFIAKKNFNIIGFIYVGMSKTSEYENFGELKALYLTKEHQKLGIGKKLFMTGLDWLCINKFESMFLWVFKENTARFFYEHLGGKLSFSRTINIGGKNLEEESIVWKKINYFYRKKINNC